MNKKGRICFQWSVYLIDLGEKGINQMITIQKNILKMDALWIGTGGK